MRLRPRLDGLILGKAGTGGMGSSPAASLFPLVPGVGESPSPPRVTESPLRLQGQGWTAVSAHHGRGGAHPSSGMKASASPELYQTQVPGKGLLPCGPRDTWRVGPAPAHLLDARTHGSMCRPAHTQCTSRMHMQMHMYAHIQSKHTCTCIRTCSACPHSVTHSCVHNAHTHTQCTSCTHTRTCTHMQCKYACAHLHTCTSCLGRVLQCTEGRSGGCGALCSQKPGWWASRRWRERLPAGVCSLLAAPGRLRRVPRGPGSGENTGS